MTTYLDSAKRRQIVATWIPTSLVFLHIWSSLLVAGAVLFNLDNDTISSMFDACGWGITGLILLLISDRALDLVISRTRSAIEGQTIEKTTTEKTVVMPAPEQLKEDAPL